MRRGGGRTLGGGFFWIGKGLVLKRATVDDSLTFGVVK